MKLQKLFLCLFMLVVLAGQLFAAPGLNRIQANINKAGKLWSIDSAKSGEMLRVAFSDAIAWTRPEYIDSIRERAFYLAVSCFYPELADEVRLAAETYTKLFPEGRYLRQVNIFKALAAFSVEDIECAVAAIEAAEKASKKKKNYKTQTVMFNSYMAANHHRSAEKFIESERLKSPSGKLKKDLRRFHQGNRLIEALLKKFKSGKISASDAVKLIDKELERSWFAKKAPEAALTSVAIKDRKRSAYNPVFLEWCGLKRAVKHSASPQLREKKYLDFLETYPQAEPGETYHALQNLRNIYLYEYRDKIKARQMLEKMKMIPGFEDRAEIECEVCNFSPDMMLTETGNIFLARLLNENHLPYDNEALPVLEVDHISLMLAISNMALNKNGDLKLDGHFGWNGLPVSLLYNTVIEQKTKAWETYSSIRPGLSKQVDRMLEDCLFPLYLPTPESERYFLAGLAAMEKFPDQGVDLIFMALSNQPRMYRSEHALAVLADVYNQHLAYREAQQVWQLLGKLHPESIWLR
jgi:hypothetical protein